MGLNYFIGTIISALALFIGAWIAWATKEELKVGKKYFHILGNLFLAIIAFLYFYEINVLIGFALALVILLVTSFYPVIKHDYAVYALFGFIFWKNDLVLNSLIFLYGLPAGTLIAMNKKYLTKMLIVSLIFIAIANIQNI